MMQRPESGRTRDGTDIRLFGYRLHPMTKLQLLDLLFAARTRSQSIVVASANLHGLYMFERNAAYRALHARQSTVVIVDGMPVIWLLKLMGYGVGRDHRTTWVDWFEDALDRAASQGSRVFILGHTRSILAEGRRRAAARWPTLQIGTHDGFFDIADSDACASAVDAVNAYKPDLLFVGMGMPRQEAFIAAYGDRITAPVIGLGGAAFAYFAGDQARPPRWMGHAGLEWLHRLASNPRRLAARYLLEPILLLIALGCRLIREASRKAFSVGVPEKS